MQSAPQPGKNALQLPQLAAPPHLVFFTTTGGGVAVASAAASTTSAFTAAGTTGFRFGTAFLPACMLTRACHSAILGEIKHPFHSYMQILR